MDTHVVLWFRLGVPRIGPECRRIIDEGLREGRLATSAFSFWETAMLQAKGRIRLSQDVRSWRARLLRDGLVEIPVDGDIALLANELEDFHGDPADRIIVATALSGHTLVTADHRILSWSGRLGRLDARR